MSFWLLSHDRIFYHFHLALSTKRMEHVKMDSREEKFFPLYISFAFANVSMTEHLHPLSSGHGRAFLDILFSFFLSCKKHCWQRKLWKVLLIIPRARVFNDLLMLAVLRAEGTKWRRSPLYFSVVFVATRAGGLKIWLHYKTVEKGGEKRSEEKLEGHIICIPCCAHNKCNFYANALLRTFLALSAPSCFEHGAPKRTEPILFRFLTNGYANGTSCFDHVQL